MVELALIVQVQKVLFLLHRVLMRVLNLVELASIWLMLHLTDLIHPCCHKLSHIGARLGFLWGL